MLLSVENLNISLLKNNRYLPAVRGVNIAISPGEIFGVVGESGSGKSLTNLAIMGLLPPSAKVTADRLMFKGQDLLSFSSKTWQAFRGSEIGMIFQNPKSALNPAIKLKTHLFECLWKKQPKLSKSALLKAAASLLDQVGLSNNKIDLNDYSHTLSGGMAQRFVIAMALASDPALLIADEITTGLDPAHKKQVVDLLNTIRLERHMAIMLVSHDLKLIEAYTDRMHVMYSGELMEVGVTNRVMQMPNHPYTKGLIACLPKAESKKEHYLNAINGVALSVTQETSGCRFYDRCTVSKPECLVRESMLAKKQGLDHYVNCSLLDLE